MRGDRTLHLRWDAFTAAAPTGLLRPSPCPLACQDRATCDSLLQAVQEIKPTVLIGLSDGAPPHAFGREVGSRGGLPCRVLLLRRVPLPCPPCWRAAGVVWKRMQPEPRHFSGLPASLGPHSFLCFMSTCLPPTCGPQVCEALVTGCERPLLLPLSRQSPDGRLEASEVAAADALAWTQVWGLTGAGLGESVRRVLPPLQRSGAIFSCQYRATGGSTHPPARQALAVPPKQRWHVRNCRT